MSKIFLIMIIFLASFSAFDSIKAKILCTFDTDCHGGDKCCGVPPYAYCTPPWDCPFEEVK